MLGDFDRDSEDEDDESLAPKLLPTNKGFSVDKKGRRVNKHGWLEEDPKNKPLSPKATETRLPRNNLVDKHGRKKFDKSKLTDDGDIPKLYNLEGNKYDIKDTIGIFNRDDEDNIILKEDADGDL